MNNKIFQYLFVLELANNHWGCLERGKEIIKQFSKIVKQNNIKAAIKLQFRDVDCFIHKDYRNFNDKDDLTKLPKQSRYIQKTSKTKLSYNDMEELSEYIKTNECIPIATPFDEKSVDWCVKLAFPIIKIASSDINDWFLIHKIASTQKPVIISTGGANEHQIDDVVKFFLNRQIPIAINHCISKYPSEDHELELNQIDYLKRRYPDVTIGLSTHEYTDWHSSMLISYAKGVRTWERHIDIPYPEGHQSKEVSPYCSLPHQINDWFKAFNKATTMCGKTSNYRRAIDKKESSYLEALYRGLYFKRNLKKGTLLTSENLYSAVPYQKYIQHITSREYSDNSLMLNKNVYKDQPLTRQDIIQFSS